MVKRIVTVKKSGKNIEEQVENALQESLAKVPFIKVLSVQRDLKFGQMKVDLFAQIKVGTDEKCLVVEVKSNGQPRYARQAVNQLLRFRDLNPQCYCIFMAPYISPRAAEICIESDIGYMDLAGNSFLNFEKVHIEKTGQPNPYSEKKELRSLYSPKASRVLRALLENPRKKWKVAEIALETSVSLGQVSKVKNLLANKELIKDAHGGFELIDPARLLQDWSENYSYRKNRIFKYYSMNSIPDIEWALSQACTNSGRQYALTSFSGAARLKAFVKYQRVFAFVQGDVPKLATSLNLKEVDSGENIILLEPYDEGVFYGSTVVESISIANPIQIYLDLKGYRGRGEEAAEAILEGVIKNRW